MPGMDVQWDFPTRWGALLLCKAVIHGNLKQLKMLKDATDVLQIKSEDVKRLNIIYDKELHWNPEEGNVEEGFILSDEFITFLREKIKELDAKNMIPTALLPLAESLGLE